MVGLPVEVMANHQLALATRRQLRAWLRATHTFSVADVPMTVEVAQVQIMAQPAGAFFAWGFDNAGHWQQDQAAAEATIGICDIGFNTLDLFSIQGGRVQGRYTGGDNLGLSRAAELLIQSLHRSHGCRLSKHQADALLRQRNPALVLGGKTVDLRGMTTQALNASASRITSFLADTWGSGGQFGYTLFVGGGAAALRRSYYNITPKGLSLRSRYSPTPKAWPGRASANYKSTRPPSLGSIPASAASRAWRSAISKLYANWRQLAPVGASWHQLEPRRA